MNTATKNHKASERGEAGVKLIAILVVLFLIAHASYNYVPVAYQGASFKQDMQTAVVQGMAPTGGLTPLEMVKNNIKVALRQNDIPTDAFVEVKPGGNVVQARVVYAKRVNLLPFGMFAYTYNFDHTATPAGFLMK